MSIATDEIVERLEDWRRHGLVSAAQCDAIVAHERARATAGARHRGDRTTAAEAIGYLGAALVLGAVALFVGEYWDAFTVAARLTLAVLVTVVLAGAAAGLRRATSPAVQRLVSVLTTGVVVGVAWCTSLVTAEILELRAVDVGLVCGVVATVVAAPLYLARRRALPQLTALASVVALVAALVARPELPLETWWSALPFVGLGVVWWSLAEGGWLRPRVVAATAGSVLAVLATQFAAFDDHRFAPLVLGVVLAAALVAWSVARGGVHHLAVGAVAAFVFVPQVVVDRFGDAVGAPATLLLTGIVLVLLAVGLGRVRREVAVQGADL